MQKQTSIEEIDYIASYISPLFRRLSLLYRGTFYLNTFTTRKAWTNGLKQYVIDEYHPSEPSLQLLADQVDSGGIVLMTGLLMSEIDQIMRTKSKTEYIADYLYHQIDKEKNMIRYKRERVAIKNKTLTFKSLRKKPVIKFRNNNNKYKMKFRTKIQLIEKTINMENKYNILPIIHSKTSFVINIFEHKHSDKIKNYLPKPKGSFHDILNEHLSICLTMNESLIESNLTTLKKSLIKNNSRRMIIQDNFELTHVSDNQCYANITVTQELMFHYYKLKVKR